MCIVCAVEGISAPDSHSGIQADRDSAFFSIDLNQMDVYNSNAICEMNSSQVPRRKGNWVLEHKANFCHTKHNLDTT